MALRLYIHTASILEKGSLTLKIIFVSNCGIPMSKSKQCLHSKFTGEALDQLTIPFPQCTVQGYNSP